MLTRSASAAQSAEDEPLWSHCFLSWFRDPAARQPCCSDKHKLARHMARGYKEPHTVATYVTVRSLRDCESMVDVAACEHISLMNGFIIPPGNTLCLNPTWRLCEADAGQYLPNSYLWMSLKVGNVTDEQGWLTHIGQLGNCELSEIWLKIMAEEGLQLNLIYADYVMSLLCRFITVDTSGGVSNRHKSENRIIIKKCYNTL